MRSGSMNWSHDPMQKILVIGGGKGGKALIELFQSYDDVRVVAVVDTREDAPGMLLARQLDIPTARSYARILKDNEPDIIVNVTGDAAVSKAVKQLVSDDVEILEGFSARLLWGLTERERQIRAHAEEAKSRIEKSHLAAINIIKTSHLKDAIKMTLSEAMNLTSSPAGSIALYDHDSREMQLFVSKGFSQKFRKADKWRLRPGGITEYIIRSDEPVAIEDIDEHPSFNNPVLKQEGVRSLVAAPLLSNGRIIGILYVDDFKARAYSGELLGLLGILARESACLLEKFRLLEELKTKNAELKKFSDQLERMVADQTAELKKLSTTIEHSLNIIIIMDGEGRIEYVNPMFETVSGYTIEEVRGLTLSIISPEFTLTGAYKKMLREIQKGNTWRGETKNRNKSGGDYWTNTVVSPIKNEAGEITHYFSVQEDITEKKKAAKQAQYLSTHDETTGLFNRPQFMELVNLWLANAVNNDEAGALMIIDMDDFMLINDTYGHNAGDEFIQQVARAIEESLRKLDALRNDACCRCSAIARLSADEFAIITPAGGGEEALEIAEAIRAAITECRIPGHPCDITETASIGIALYPEHGVITTELLTKADTALYRAKELGKDRSYVFSPENGDEKVFHSRRLWKERIVRALEEDRFEPWFQPMLNLKTNEIDHYEALARMRDEDGGIISPGAFIEAAERYKLIDLIDRDISQKVMRFQAELQRSGRHEHFSMNLSGKNIGNEKLLSALIESIEKSGADPRYLTFELTETAAVKDLDKASRFIGPLKNLGCKISLDDFGVGFTSFLYLSELQVDIIKIDGYFIKKLAESPRDRLFVKAITDVAKGMGIVTVAEFVNGGETLEMLRELGVDYAQGFMIGKPSPDLSG
ncbi:MAG TPA: EAL domain-containing protein [Sedimenticola sp.]|nr:EAL domain-containing protein [Sedimenticola sp.]